MSKVQEALTLIVIELIENKAVLQELERSRGYTDSSYYWRRQQQVLRRIDECERILMKAQVGWVKDAPVEQYLVVGV